MAFNIKNPPEFTLEVEQWNRETPADGGEMAKTIEKLLNNEIYNKKENERQDHVALVTLDKDGWSGTVPPYQQTVSVPGAAADREAFLLSALEDGAAAEVQKAYSKAFGIVSSGTAILGEGTATFKAYKRPETTITVGLKGVM